MRSTPKIIVLEGQDRVGKSTIASSLSAMLPKSINTYEPFFLTKYDRKHTEAFFQDRLDHLDYLHDLLSKRKVDYLIIDRYIDSFFAYEKKIESNSKEFKYWYDKHYELNYLFADYTFLIKRNFATDDIEMLDDNDIDEKLQSQVLSRYEDLKNKKVFWRNNMIEVVNSNMDDTIGNIYNIITAPAA